MAETETYSRKWLFLYSFIIIFLLSGLLGYSRGKDRSDQKIVSHFEYRKDDAGDTLVTERTLFRILPGVDNPRNSEGDFITLNNGRILFIYSHYTGTSGGDNASAYLAGRYSDDGGRTWSPEDITIVKQEGTMNVMSVSLLRLKNGEIALFYLRKNSTTDCIPMMRISKDEASTWSDPFPCITDKSGYFVVNNDRVIQLKNGRILIPVAVHKPGYNGWAEYFTLCTYYSDDAGLTWTSGSEVPNYENVLTQEPGVVELKNEDIFMFIRTNKGAQYKSISKDKGLTWTPAERSNIVSPLSPASISRIPSTGDLILAWNRNGTNQKRTPLCISISKDDGNTWTNTKVIEDDPNGSFCYTAIHFSGQNIFLGYWNRADKNNSSIDINRLTIGLVYK
jgi:Neuraminidase (sialidase)